MGGKSFIRRVDGACRLVLVDWLWGFTESVFRQCAGADESEACNGTELLEVSFCPLAEYCFADD